MQRIISFGITLFLGSILIGCQPEGRVFEEHQDLSPNIEWLKKDARSFDVTIKDVNTPYNVRLAFRYANGYPYPIARVKLTEKGPEGQINVSEHDLKVRSKNGEYIGEPGYDIWDSEHLILPNKTYSAAGNYTYTVEHAMPTDPLNFAMEVGLIIDQVKQ